MNKPDPTAMSWYVVCTEPSKDDKVRIALRKLRTLRDLRRVLGRVLLRRDPVTEVRGGEAKVMRKKSFRGYILVECVYGDDVLTACRDCKGFLSFLPNNTSPQTLSPSEVARFVDATEEDTAAATYKLDYGVGDTVVVLTGLWKGSVGKVKDIDQASPSAEPAVSVVCTVLGRDVVVNGLNPHHVKRS